MQTTYFKGDLVRYTGNKQEIGGKVFYEVVVIEGRLLGKILHIVRAPS